VIVRGANPSHFEWLWDRTSCPITPGFRAIEAVDAKGRIVGMVGFDGWTDNSCQAHMAVDYPAVWRSLLQPAFAYPFVENNRKLLVGTIAANNARSLALAKRMGFKETYRIRDAWADGVDLVLVEMRREECRFLGEN
jgi:RimJ/RimL family protein N-acetyltransferase